MILNRFRIAFVLALLALTGYFILQWKQTGMPQTSEQMNPPVLPLSPERVDNKVLEEILARNILDPARGKVEDVVEKSEPESAVDKQWHLLATAVQQLHEPIAVISTRGKMKSVHEGDILPDGSRLVVVMEDGIVVEEEGKEHHVYMFGKK